ncbi:MAG: hypothetical protein ABIA37_00075 [Candidatus Woesearchaeota archaeon]
MEKIDIAHLGWWNIADYIKEIGIEPDLGNPQYQEIYQCIREGLYELGSRICQYGCATAYEYYESLIPLLPEEDRELERRILEDLD